MPTLSIVVPTRNRPDYLIDSVNTALAHCKEAQIVVCDNSDTDELRARLSEHVATGRVVYDYSCALRSVVDNFEHARTLATGDYLIFIGDDDAVGPGLSEIAAWSSANGVEAAVSYSETLIAIYYWPGVRSKFYGDGYAARLFLWPFSGRVQPIDGLAELRRVCSRFGGNLGALPRAYHGLVARSLLDRIAARHGHVFGGVSPDIYSAALISAHSRASVLVDFPFVIPGASSSSTAGQGARRSDRGKLEQTDHIARFGTGLVWDARIPAFYSPQTVWAFSLQMALDRLPELGIVPSYGRLYARCLLFCHGHWHETFKCIRLEPSRSRRLQILAKTLAGLAAETYGLALRVAKRAMAPRAMGHALRFEGLSTVSAAYTALTGHIARIGPNLRLPADGVPRAD